MQVWGSFSVSYERTFPSARPQVFPKQNLRLVWGSFPQGRSPAELSALDNHAAVSGEWGKVTHIPEPSPYCLEGPCQEGKEAG